MARMHRLSHPSHEKFLRRAKSRGAAMFVVMMAIVLLTGLGTWVVYASGLAASGAGNQRAAVQTLHLAELGVLAGTGYLAQPDMAKNQMATASASLVANNADDCVSVPTAVARPFCKSIFMSDIDDSTVDSSTFEVLDLTSAEGSMGPDGSVTEGFFFLEVSDPRPIFRPGQPDNQSYNLVTITSYGSTRPAGAGICAGSTGENAAATMMGMRTQAVIGPL